MAKYNDKEQPEWRYSINLNTIIAVLATVLRSCMVVVAEEVISQLKWLLFRRPRPLWQLEHFDTATRGPWGSLLLFFRTRSLGAAFVGCIVIILSVGIGPFSQQAVKSVSCERPLAGAEGHSKWDLDLDTKVAILDGLVNPNTTRSDITPSCSTGNSSILNVSIVTFTNHGCESLGREDDPKFQRCPGADANWTLPVMNFLNAVAATCSFYPCVRDYAGTVRNTTFTETVIKETPIKPARITKESRTYDFKDLHSPWIIDNQIYTRNNISSVPIQGNNFSSYFLNSISTTFPTACIYGIDGDYALSLGRFMQSVMSGNCSTVAHFVPEFYKNDYKALVCNPWQLEALVNKGRANFDTINRNMQSVATAVTSEMRRKGSYYDPEVTYGPRFHSAPPTFVTGTVLRTTTCTKFDWAWLSFPLALMILTTLLLCITCGKMVFDKSGVPVWKSSILPLLLAGHRLRDVAAAEDMDDMKANTKLLIVSLVQDERGWEFVIEEFKDKKRGED
ncbi:hypothetical protein COCMIDRAFT_34755 [Bipolaris oryzae ATCC 44560]|uniref:Uncharacterized protein n=1 Tax=Bipolaris oryzae ATCC 44560 TaxID=930090 RepID=W6Z7K6_COCMI|nr:uncharacterized protein COCMIDRAFT_34755 [Bipolaris oryzae ATCC 44560]EUC47687.1 hypothetical protein COCMIDRAFT_34755 [Bipolaris oryzae ATCC 44560]